MSTITLSPQLSASPELRLSNSRSAALFVEAMQLIRRYEETSARDMLEGAQKVLKDCVAASPYDALPRFYLGITHSVLGDLDQEEAISVFEEFKESKIFSLRAAATYNLAAAYVETYDPERFRKGIRLLNNLLNDLHQVGAPLGQYEWIRGLLRRFGRFLGAPRVRVEQLFYQSEETRDYFRIHLDLWKPRWDGKVEQIEAEADCMLQELEARRERIRRHEGFLGRQRAQIWAWHWNNVGSVHEVRAALAKRIKDQERASCEAYLAETAYLKAVDEDPSFGSSLPNLGRLKFEIFGDVDAAIEAFEEVVGGVEDTEYAHYYFGQLYSVKRDKGLAMEHFLKAPSLVRNEWIMPDWASVRRFVAGKLNSWHQHQAALDLLEELANESPDDEGLHRKIEELRGILPD